VTSVIIQEASYLLEVWRSLSLVRAYQCDTKSLSMCTNCAETRVCPNRRVLVSILADPAGAASWDDVIFLGERYFWAKVYFKSRGAPLLK